MIIVCGHLRAMPGRRQRLLELSASAVAQARTTPGCFDYAVSADLLDPDRVNVFERWETAAALTAFRNDGPGEDMSALIESFAVDEFLVPSNRP